MGNALRIYTLGTLKVYLDGVQVENFETDKVRALLSYLAVENARHHRREALAGLLWSDQPEQRALHSLRQALSVLRKILERSAENTRQADKAPIILAERGTLSINPEVDLWLDVQQFETLLELAYRHYQRSNGSGRLNFRRLKQAVGLYRGNFLRHFYLHGSPLFEEWAMLKRENINQRTMEALSYLADYHERRGELLLARQAAQRLAQLAPWEEGPCIKIVQLLAQEGHWSAALAQAQKFTQYLQKELGVEPSTELTALIDNTRRRTLGPPGRLQRQPSICLPLPETAFVGRETELDQLADLLADPSCRLVTLVGAGGIGKTRLAIEAAGEQAGLFAGGVFFVPLSGIHHLPGLVSGLGDVLGFHFFEGSSSEEQMLAFLRQKDLLLVLDTCEHLLSESVEENGVIPFLTKILKGSERLKILATSRAPLNLRMEHIVQVGALAYPESDARPDHKSYSAIHLFEQTARRLQPQFSLESEWTAVAEICRTLDGVPLAIELSAAWVRTNSCAGILREIQSNPDFLSTRMHDVPARHRSLRAVFDHSWRLLPGPEQEAFRRLSVFQGNFSVQAAVRVTGAGEELLANLAQKSLLQRTGAGRFGVHSLVQQYAAEKLSEVPGEAQETKRLFSEYYMGFLVDQTAPLKSAAQQRALEKMTQEMSNWQQAWYWQAEQPGAQWLELGAEAVFHFYNIRGGFQEGTELLQAAASRLQTELGARMAYGSLLAYVGALAYRAHDDHTSLAALEQARQILEEEEAAATLPFCLVFWAGMMSRKKEHGAAMDAVSYSIQLYRQVGDRWGEGYALYLQALLLNRRGKVEEAAQALEAALAAARQSGDQHRQIGPLSLLGDQLSSAGDFDNAIRCFEEAWQISRAIGDRFNEALVALNLGTVYHLRQEYGQARRLYQDSLKISEEIGDWGGQALALSNLGELASDCGEHQQALEIFQQGLALSRKMKDDWAELSCLNNLTNTCLETGDLEAAQVYTRPALKLAAELDAPPVAGITLFHLARLRLLQGQRQQATALLSVVLATDGLEDYIRQKALQVCQAAGLALPARPTYSLKEALRLALYLPI